MSTSHRFWVNIWPHTVGGGTYNSKERAQTNGQGAEMSIEIAIAMPPPGGAPAVSVVSWIAWDNGEHMTPRAPEPEKRCNVAAASGGKNTCLACGCSWDAALGVVGCIDGANGPWKGAVYEGGGGPRDNQMACATSADRINGAVAIEERTRKLLLRELLEPMAKRMRHRAGTLGPGSSNTPCYELVGAELALVNMVLAEYLGPEATTIQMGGGR